MSLFQEVAVLLALSALVGAIAVKLRQPLIIAYILVGILAGPAVLGLSSENEPLELLAEIGITVLLFVVGLKLDMRLVRTLGPVALATGLGQLSFTIVFGFILCYLMGLELMTALYVAVALTFSSTIIIVKLLSDKGEIDSLHGRIAMGFLIVQDIAVVLAMLVISLYQPASSEKIGLPPLALVGALLASLVLLYLLVRFVLPRLLVPMARSPELLMLVALCFALCLVPVALTRRLHPAPLHPAPLELRFSSTILCFNRSDFCSISSNYINQYRCSACFRAISSFCLQSASIISHAGPSSWYPKAKLTCTGDGIKF